MSEDHREWNVEASCFAKNTFNPIRNIVDNMVIKPNPRKHMIALSIGDPTIFGNLKTHPEIVDAVITSVESFKYNGYAPSVGYPAAREAVAKFTSTPGDEIQAKDVIFTSGASSALDLCITCLANPGDNVLVPRPGFPLYSTLASGVDIETKHYNLDPEKQWEVDLDDMEGQIDSNTKAIVVNNPSNPCGSVFSKQHLLDILAIADKYKLPIIADEIYDYFVFPPNVFYPLSSLTSTVPVLSCRGLTKRFIVPGWRTGWILIQDKNNVLAKEVRKGLQALSQRTIGSNTIIQGAIPDILHRTPETFFVDCVKECEDNAMYSYTCLSAIPGLKPIMPQGAMYMMVGIDMKMFPEFKSDIEFTEALVKEQSVFCLPGKCFRIPNYVRLVMTVPKREMEFACERIGEFCLVHTVADHTSFPEKARKFHSYTLQHQESVDRELGVTVN